MENRDSLTIIAAQFAGESKIASIEALGNGNINDTFLVSLDSPSPSPHPPIPLRRFVLQRLNTQVFQQPHLVVQNLRALTNHVHQRLQRTPLQRRWEMPRLIPTAGGEDCWQGQDGSCWRALGFIEGSESFDTLEDTSQAQEVGHALGTFHTLISDLSPDNFADTLEGFHITPRYLQYYGEVLEKTCAAHSPEVKYCLAFVRQRQHWVDVLETAKEQGKLPLRLMHGDPKINNVLFDSATGKAVSIIDLDTVKPGLVHYDIGDCLRSGCNLAGEETEQWETVCFELDLCQSLLAGYLAAAKAFFTENDYAYLYDAIRLIAFELGLRFLTDHLAGNVYFKVKHPEHNLARALVQFKLTESIESQKTPIRQLIRDLQ
jgi:Ser/Thr protein kinase RdoA (MazF antagonist)